MIRTREGTSPGGSGGDVPTEVSAFVNDVPYLTASTMMDMDAAKLAMSAVQPAQLSSAISALPVQQPADWNATAGVTRVLNKPVIPAAQVQADWNASTGLGVILNKPTIPTLPARYAKRHTTDATGLVTITFPTGRFTVAPEVSAQVVNSDTAYVYVADVISVSATTLVVQVYRITMATFTLLGLTAITVASKPTTVQSVSITAQVATD